MSMYYYNKIGFLIFRKPQIVDIIKIKNYAIDIYKGKIKKTASHAEEIAVLTQN